MKKILLILSGIMMIASIMAQVPQGITHQAVMRDSQNQPIVESPIGVRISILQGGVDGEAVYVETHSPMSNANGLITYVIGQGAVESGLFSEIDWTQGPYFLKTEADPMGGTDYIISGVTQFHSVPYALYAEESAEKAGTYAGEIKYWDGSAWTAIQPGAHGQTLTLCDDVPTWGPCGYTLFLQASPNFGGTVTGVGEYNEGDIVEINATANQNWTFVNWSDEDGNVVSDDAFNTIEMPAFDLSLTANFELHPGNNIMAIHDVTAMPGDIITIEIEIINTEEFVAFNLRIPLPEGFTYVEESEQLFRGTDHIFAFGVNDENLVSIIAFSTTHDAFTGNDGVVFSFDVETPGEEGYYDLPLEDAVLGNSDAVDILDDTLDGLVTLADPNIAYTLTLIENPGNAGILEGEGDYNFTDMITVTATPEEGWEFVNWTDDDGIVSEAASFTYTMPAEDITLTANFQEEESDIIYGDGVTDIDGNEYVTVIIGNQEWMAENLRVTRYNNGDDIHTGLDGSDWGNTTSGAYAIYNNDDNMLEAYGKLYNWYAVDDSRGLCPEGWSVPSHDDWTQLEQYICNALGNSDCETHFPYDNTTTGWRGTNEGNALKSCRQVGSPLEGCNTTEHPRWNSHSTHYGFDEFGFSALPSGFRMTVGSYLGIGDIGTWWSSSEYTSTGAWIRGMGRNYEDVTRGYSSKQDGFSARCFRGIVRTEDE